MKYPRAKPNPIAFCKINLIGINNLKQLQAHKETATKKVEQNIFKKALSIKYENEKILNPSLYFVYLVEL